MSAWPSPTYAALSHSDAIASLIERGRPWRGSIHSVFRSTLNIATDGALLTVAAPSAGRLPNGIAADLGPDFRRLGIVAGMTVEHGAGTLSIDNARIVIDIRGAARWSPRLAEPSGDVTATARRWHARAPGVRARAAAVARGRPGRERGLEALIWPDPGNDSSGGLAARAAPLLDGIALAIRDNDRDRAAEIARTVIGHGPGLTPSGDDALVGLEAACHAVRSPLAGFLIGALDDVDERTTAIAATFLRHAGRGEFAERLHGLLADLIGSDVARIGPAIEAGIAWGASSGTDCLVGILYGLDAATAAAAA